MKVVWICHYFNKEILSRFDNLRYKEMAPWMNELANLFADVKDIELHIVMPNSLTRKDEIWGKSNVNYYLYKFGFPFQQQQKYNLNVFMCSKRKVRRIVDKIKPDIIHLHGTENAYYSAMVIPLLKRYPVLVTIQGFISMSTRKKGFKKIIRLRRVIIEKKILRKAKYFGVRNKYMIEIIKKLNAKAKYYGHDYGLNIPPIKYAADIEGNEYDLVFFARMTKDKGIEDFLSAVALLKKKWPNIRALIVGGANPIYFKKIIDYCEENEIDKNVVFLGNLPQNEAFKEISKAKISVLPTYNDIVPGTIIECMFLKIPVVAYETGGLPEINENGENIILVKRGDIKNLSEKINYLLENKLERRTLGEKGYEMVKRRYDKKRIVPGIIEAYQNIIKENETN